MLLALIRVCVQVHECVNAHVKVEHAFMAGFSPESEKSLYLIQVDMLVLFSLEKVKCERSAELLRIIKAHYPSGAKTPRAVCGDQRWHGGY